MTDFIKGGGCRISRLLLRPVRERKEAAAANRAVNLLPRLQESEVINPIASAEHQVASLLGAPADGGVRRDSQHVHPPSSVLGHGEAVPPRA
ncbi:hypothetical protein HCN51_13240 [Nonomuraea sp. FMUSA5-5]|uniref:Uncharacterized protein n=1 Tax=Nonomuraea composti TaxID=2720023 RepID=A0ABX1B3S2_9ACTN|nr:hypothetical protein [Nonomuraea sp. FMUSA5-5]NJP90406.1 hypothetical protein [Nonomuraea sp. FMUSA5-5]